MKENAKLSEKLERYKSSQDKWEKQMSKMEHECTLLTNERDELVTQLEKSQDLLLQFQKELNSKQDGSTSEINSLLVKVKTLETEVIPTIKQQMQGEINKLGNSLKEKTGQLNENNNKIQSLQQLIAKLKEDIGVLEERGKKLAAEKKVLMDEINQSGSKNAVDVASTTKLKEENARIQAEMDRLLKLMQMTQEEQNTKDKTISQLQDALRAERAKASTADQGAAAVGGFLKSLF
jgi:chromosome segregation ATPase